MNRTELRSLRFGPGCRRHRPEDGTVYTKPPIKVRAARNRRFK